ncbi:MAG: ABC transporter permease [Planctomycetes bacterium]|nr:ABC transporter permease [Planctomycetota bacterium]
MTDAPAVPDAGLGGRLLASYTLGLKLHLAGSKKYGYAVLVALPALFAALWALLAPPEVDGHAFYAEAVLSGFIFKLVLPLIGVLVGVGAIANEKQNQTLPYLLVRPLPKPFLFLSRFASALTISVLLAAVALALPMLVLGMRGGGFFREAPAVLGWSLCAAGLALSAYAAIFVSAGAGVPHPTVFSLLYAFLWEAVLSGIQEEKIQLSRFVIVNAARGFLFENLARTPDFNVPEHPVLGILAVTLLALVPGLLIFSNSGYSK